MGIKSKLKLVITIWIRYTSESAGFKQKPEARSLVMFKAKSFHVAMLPPVPLWLNLQAAFFLPPSFLAGKQFLLPRRVLRADLCLQIAACPAPPVCDGHFPAPSLLSMVPFTPASAQLMGIGEESSFPHAGCQRGTQQCWGKVKGALGFVCQEEAASAVLFTESMRRH